MKTPNDDVFRLVRTMTASEKRYFKMHFASENSLMTALFNFLNSLKNYDEQQVKSHFAATKLAKNLKVYKVQLMNQLLRSLASYHAKNSAKRHNRNELGEIEMLFDKQLNDLGYKRLLRLKKKCLKNEHFTLLLEVLELQLNYYSLLGLDAKIQNIYVEIQQHQRSFHHLEELKMANRLLETQYALLSSNKIEKLFFQDLLSKSNHSDKQQYLNLQKLYFNSVQACIDDLYERDFEKVKNIRKVNVQKFLDKPAMESLYPYLFWQELRLFLKSMLHNRKFAEWDEIYKQAELHLRIHSNLQISWHILQNLRLAKNYYTRKWSAFQKDFSQIETSLTELVHLDEQVFLNHKIYNLCAGVLQAQPQLPSYYKTLNRSSQKAVRELTEIINLIHQYEQQQKVSWNPHADDSTLESSFLKEFAQKVNEVPMKDLAAYFQNNASKFEKDPTWQLFHKLDLNLWFDALLEGVSLAHYVNRQKPA